jgi:hypothetical protein
MIISVTCEGPTFWPDSDDSHGQPLIPNVTTLHRSRYVANRDKSSEVSEDGAWPKERVVWSLVDGREWIAIKS